MKNTPATLQCRFNNSSFLRSSKLKALEGRPKVAQGKRELASAPPWVESTERKPLTAKPRDSANLTCRHTSSPSPDRTRAALFRSSSILFLALALLFLITGCQTVPPSTSAPTISTTETWRGVHVPVRDDRQLTALQQELPQFAAAGVNVVVIEVNYNFDFKSHPELRSPRYMTKAKAREFTAAARRLGIRVIPELDCLGHQSWAQTTLPLLVKYPQLDETPGKFPDNKGIYCRSWCPQNPEVYKIIFPMIDEIADAFQADMFHVGMDEVFIIADKSCPLCHDEDPAKLFALCVNKLHAHITGQRHMQMLMWGDRLLNAHTMGNHMYEESMNGTWPAADMIPKDIIICDWHYDYHPDYPSVPLLLSKGFRVWPSGFRPLEATEAFSQFSLDQRERNKNVIGYLATTWSAAGTNDLATWPPITQILPEWEGK